MEYSYKLLEREAQALSALNTSIDVLESKAFDQATIASVIQAQFFTPEQDLALAEWFAHFLSLKQNIWSIVDNAIEVTGGTAKIEGSSDDVIWAYFVIGYSAVCSLVRLDHFLLNTLAYDSIFQRKLNEGFKEYRIERKQWTAVYRAVTLPSNAFKIIMAHKTYKRHRADIQQALLNLLVQNESWRLLKKIYAAIPEQERYLNLRWYRCVWAGLNYRYHSWRRRNASLKQKSTHALLEYSGRIVSEIRLPTEKRVSKEIREQLRPLLKTGDILITRHNGALSNLFLPGFWPHAALYIGDSHERDKMASTVMPANLDQWLDNICTFEALKDGVHLRTLEATLNVDAFVVLRPNLSEEAIYKAIARVLIHAGKDYNFDFDLFRADQLVCTEVIYRAYDGVGATSIPLTERLGKKTLSAEDLLDFALGSKWATPIAIYGAGLGGDAATTATKQSQSHYNQLLVGAHVESVLINSYRQTS